MDHCDVLIIGGGPAGSSVAWGLRGSGLDVLILDKKTFPRDKVCAGWVTPSVLTELQIDAADYARTRVIQPITGFRVGIVGRKSVLAGHGGSVISYGIRRFEFDHYLLERCGARLRLGEAMTAMRRDGKEWIVNESIRSPLIIGAGGHFCPVARRMSVPSNGSRSLVAAQEIEFRMSSDQLKECTAEAETPELYFSEDLRGYAWAFRKGDFLNAGLGRENDPQVADHMKKIAAWMRACKKIPEDAPDSFKGHAYYLYPNRTRRLTDDGILLIGDAAGFAYPKSGEGIRPAVESGLIAARAIRAVRGDYGGGFRRLYEIEIGRRFGSEYANRFDSPALPEALRQILGAPLFANSWFLRSIVIDRWFLHRDQAPLTMIP